MSNNLIVGTDGSDPLVGTAGADLIYGYNPDGPQGQVTSITATRVATGLNGPLFAGSPPGDADHLFIVEQGGAIKILDLNTNQVQASPFLDLSGTIATAGEEGLLGLAFDPNYASNGFFYVDVVNTSGDTEIRRYHTLANDPTHADPSSGTLIIKIDQPNFTNHKGGWIGFGPDGDLYVAMGDGGSGGDPLGNGQNPDSLLGKMLRRSDFNDSLTGTSGNNSIDGGAGSDTASYAAATIGVVVDLSNTGAQNTVGAGTDNFVSIENLIGSAKADTLTGDGNDNVIAGNAGKDTILGGGGKDTLIGGAGADILNGEGGDDTFHYAAVTDFGDHIVGFVSGADKIEIDHTGFLHAVAGDTHFQSGATTPVAANGNASFLYNTTTGALYFDDDGNGAHKATLLLTLDGHPALNGSDILIV